MKLYGGDGINTKIHTLEIENESVTTEEVGGSFMHLWFPNIYKKTQEWLSQTPAYWKKVKHLQFDPGMTLTLRQWP